MMLCMSSRGPLTYLRLREMRISRALRKSQGSYSYEMLRGTMFSSMKFSLKDPVPLMSNILSRPCSVMSTPSLVRPWRCAIHTELLPEVMVWRIYLESSCEDRYSSRAEMPRMTLIILLDLRSFSIVLLERRLSPTQISDIGMPFFSSTYCVMAGSRMMSRWLDIMRNLPSMDFMFEMPS